MNNNIFLLFVCAASTLSMLNNSLIESSVLRSLIYGLMVLFEFLLYQNCRKHNWGGLNIANITIPLFLILISFTHSEYNPNWGLYVKYLGYVLCFVYGVICWKHHGGNLRVNKKLLYFTIFTPLILVAFFDHTPHKTVFYTLSNVYSFAGLCFCLYYYTVFYSKKNILIKSVCLLLLFILSCSTLGILFAFCMTILYINRSNMKLMYLTSVFLTVTILLVLYSDIPIFARVKDVIAVFLNMTKEDWINLRDLDMWQISKDIDYSSDRTDNTSAIWRLSHWAGLIEDYFKNWNYSLMFGLGDNYTNEVLGNVPHNDYLRFMCEYGMIVFGYIVFYIRKLLSIMAKDEALLLIIAFLIYSFTENLINTFASNALMYFCIGYHYQRCREGNIKSIKRINIFHLLTSKQINYGNINICNKKIH